ncbi:MAG: alpha/beta hydrolase [Nitrospira sp.]|nr:alpha/beta hydrolase [Nitrospira sp.]
MEIPVLVLPGFGNSGPGHWQTLWEERHPAWRRVDLGQWDAPDCREWVRTLDMAVQRCAAPPILVAHSLACLLVAHWAGPSRAPVKGAFLVAIPEPACPSFPATAKGFMPVPMHRLPFPALVVASTNDSFGSIGHARACATAWGSRFVDVGEVGHINADSGIGDWPEGYALFQEFVG